MAKFGAILAILSATVLTACAPGGVPLPGLQSERLAQVAQLPTMRVVGISVSVPRDLTVSEANTYKPNADLLWREDPFGDRYEQIRQIMQDGLSQGARSLQGDIPVVLNVEVARFHAVTERTRYTIGGVHEIQFNMTVMNARTGEIVIEPYRVNASFPAYGGEQAVAAEREGITQKSRILNQLAAIIQQELTGIPAEPAA